MNGSGKQIYRVEDVEIDPLRGCLRRNGDEVYLRPKTLQVLVYLIEQRERLVTKEELMTSIWRDTAVTDDALVQCIMDIRRALNDNPRRPHFVKTFPKIGYHFINQDVEISTEYTTYGQPFILETEDITSLELEFEQQPAEKVLPKQRDALIKREFRGVGVLLRSRAAISVSLVLLSLTAIALSFYVRHRASQSEGQLASLMPPRAPGKKAVSVMFFDNQSHSADLDWLREGLPDMLIADLSRSQKLNVLSRQQLSLLFERSGSKLADKIGWEDALELARKSQAEVMVLGSFARIGEKVRIDVQIHNIPDGQLIAAESFTADKADQILSQVDLLSLKLCADLGVIPVGQEDKKSLADVRTNNLEAYRYYSIALDKAEGLHYLEAVSLLEKAIALDHEFAMAYARIGYSYSVTGGLAEEGKPYLEKAFQLSNRLSDKDRLYINAWYAIANLDYLGAIGAYHEIIKVYPLESEAYLRLGRLLAGEERFDEAIDVLRQGLVIDSQSREILNTLGGIYVSTRKHDEALAMLQRYVSLAPDEPNAHDSLGLTYQSVGQYELAIVEYNRALAINPKFEVAIVHLGNVYFQMGQYHQAIKLYERYIEVAPSDMERARGYRYIEQVYLKKGDNAHAVETAKQTMKYEKTYSWAQLLLALYRGEVAKAEQLKQELLAKYPYTTRGTRLSMRYLSYYDGLISLKSGLANEAIASFSETLRHAAMYWDIDSFDDCLANAYLELGQLDEASEEYKRILSINPNYPLVHYHLGQTYEHQGKRARARAEYEKFIQVWKNSDADLPEIIAAKKWLASQS